MSRQPTTNGVLVVLATLAVLVLARPAASQSLDELRKNIKDELKRVENRLERIVHDAGDSFERRTGIDVDLADNVGRVAGRAEEEARELAREAGDAGEEIADDLEHAVTEFLEGVHEVGEDLLDRLCKLIVEHGEHGAARTCATDRTTGPDGSRP